MKRSNRGFTLIEVLIAMAITAFVALLGYNTLSTVITGVDSVRNEAQRLYEINRAIGVLSRDIRQVTNRSITDEFGTQASALEGGPLARETLAFTRSGWHNTLGVPRSALQRVAYYIDDDQLIRAAYPILDRSAAIEPRETILLEEVERFEVRFLGDITTLQAGADVTVDRRFWQENWLADISQPGAVIELPAAVEVLLAIEGWGEMERLYVLSSP